jgi:7-cyano-7-deazaguanine synthase
MNNVESLTDRIAPGANGSLAILISGGLDSAILLGEMLVQHLAVYPLYVRFGLYWEAAELRLLRQFLERLERTKNQSLQPLHMLDLPVADVYGDHWSLTGRNVPNAASADDAVFLPGRNVLLLAKSILWCHQQGIHKVALATLRANPFSDATPAFFNAYQAVVNQAIGGCVQVLRPYAALSKTEVMQRGRGLPLELTFSCIRPMAGGHCGRCNKCAERRQAFTAASLEDRTEYNAEPSCTA